MLLESIWPFFLLLGLALGLLALPLAAPVDAAVRAGDRYATLDGLRGFLAFGVFAFHFIVTFRYLTEGVWELPGSTFYAALGPVGVSLFFMTTGFLFWGKLLASRGRPDWRKLYKGRFLRIAPMYWVAVIAMLAIVAFKTDFERREPFGAIVTSVLKWLALGMVDTQPDVNGYPAKYVIAGVTWTIAYEWAFYASLLLLAQFARRKHILFVSIALPVALALKLMLHSSPFGFAALFLFGMAAASAQHERIKRPGSDRLASSVALLCLVPIFFGDAFGLRLSGYGTPAAILLAVFFYMVASGASVFGLLTLQAARRFGAISYSIYLLQGIILTLVFAHPGFRDFAISKTPYYWLAGGVCTVALVGISCLTYRFIELPCMRRAVAPAAQPASPKGLAKLGEQAVAP